MPRTHGRAGRRPWSCRGRWPRPRPPGRPPRRRWDGGGALEGRWRAAGTMGDGRGPGPPQRRSAHLSPLPPLARSRARDKDSEQTHPASGSPPLHPPGCSCFSAGQSHPRGDRSGGQGQNDKFSNSLKALLVPTPRLDRCVPGPPHLCSQPPAWLKGPLCSPRPRPRALFAAGLWPRTPTHTPSEGVPGPQPTGGLLVQNQTQHTPAMPAKCGFTPHGHVSPE